MTLGRLTLRAGLMTAGSLAGVLCFGGVAVEVFSEQEAVDIDRSASAWARALRTPMLTQAMTDLTALGSLSVLLVLSVILAAVLLAYRDRKGLAFLGALGAGALLWPMLLKPMFSRPRPLLEDRLVHVSDLSFPSGHAFASAAIYIGLAYYAGQYARRWSEEVFFYCLGAALTLIVGVSRIYLGVHYPTDVLAGLSGGIAWGLLVSALYEIRFRRGPKT